MQETLIEELSSVEHERWSGWMVYQFSKGTLNDDGTWTMPRWAVERWMRQAETPYSELSEEEKESDRKEAVKSLSVFQKHYKSNLQ